MCSGSRPRLLVGHPFWGRGGAEIATMWLIESLGGLYDIDLITRGGFDLNEMNRCAATHVGREGIRKVIHPPFIPRKNGMGGAYFHALYLRHCRRLAPRYDLCITASRTQDWGVPALHFLSDVTWNPALQQRFQSPEALVGTGVLRRAYAKSAEIVAGSSGKNLLDSGTLVANSQWTADISSPYCKTPPLVIAPAVPEQKHVTPCADKVDEFICLGRVSPEKKLACVIAIMDQVRAMGARCRLHIVGSGDGGDYEIQIRRLCAERGDWITWHGAVFGDEKNALFSRCRYGISGCDIEAFGIATAEMAGAGIIPFVPRRGAQREIVREADLIYSDIDDAASKIVALLRSPGRRNALHGAMLSHAEDYRPKIFREKVRVLVRDVITKNRNAGNLLANG